MGFIEKPISINTVLRGRIFNVRQDTVLIADGREVSREVVEHSGGVCIVPVDVNGIVYCVRQFRYPFMEEILELPAGKLEIGEYPEHCAVRELSEETGLIANNIISLGSIYPTPGYCSEELHLFLATDLKQGKAHPDPGEFLSVERKPIKELIDMAYRNEIKDGKTIAGLFRAAHMLEKPGLYGKL